MLFFELFGLEFEKAIVTIEINALAFNCKVWCKIKILKFLDWNFKKTIVIFEISTLEFVGLQNFVKK